jgi:Mu-like prophage I protein
MTGPITITRDDLVGAVAAANDDPGIPTPKLKLTLMDDTHGMAVLTEPSFGRVTNLRFDENEQMVYADFEGVPAWLADILPVAYPSRSVELLHGVKTTTGGNWDTVIESVQLLGVEWPGCTTLEDLPLWYGENQPKTVVLKLDKTMATALARGGKMADKLSVAVEDVRRAYYEILNNEGNWSWWCKQVLLDPDQLVIEDEYEGDLYLVDFSTSGDTITFGDPKKVKIEYVPAPEDATQKKVAASIYTEGIAASGRKVLASYASAREAGRITKLKGETQMSDEDRKALAVKLGLPEDATEEQVNAKLQENALEAGASGEGGDTPPTPAADAKPEDKPDVDKVDETTAGDGAAKPTELSVTMDRGQLEQLRYDAALGRESRLAQVKGEAEKLVLAAKLDGRIAPASEPAWLAAIFDAKQCKLIASEVEALSKLAKGRIPIEERGRQGGGTGDDTDLALSGGEAYPQHWFPEVEQRKTRLKAAEARGARVYSEAV